MGANYKLLKQRLNEERSKITDRQFFTSRLLAGHFEGIAAAYTRRYDYRRRVRVNLFWEPENGSLAFTDNLVASINTGNSWVTETVGRKERYEIVCGLFAHEFGHILYTDFLSGQTLVNSFAAGKWYPEPPELIRLADQRNEADLWEYVRQDPLRLKAVQYVVHELSNILEDGYVENRILLEFPGSLAYGLEAVRAKHFQKMLTVTQMKEREENGKGHIFATLEQMLLSYATTVDTDKITAPTRTFWHGEGATPVVLIHKDWTLGETDRFLGIKAGKARTGHGHMDAGSFVYDALGCRWAMDLGSQSYTQVEEAGVNLWSMVQNSERWTKVLRIRSDYHNTLTMDLSPFQVDNMCNILETYNSDTEQGAKVDLSGTLGNQYVQSAIRTIKLVDSKDLVIHDEVTTAVYGSLRWAMVTPAVPTKISDTCFKLEQNGKTMYMIVESNPEVTLNTWSTDPLYEWDSPNTGTIIVGFDVSVSAGTDVTFNVTLTETPPSGNQF